MSTSYYALRKPITRVAVEVIDEYVDQLRIWTNDTYAGNLNLLKDEVSDVLRLFFDTDRDVMVEYWGGPDMGVVVGEKYDGLENWDVLLDEYGHLTTVSHVRLQMGKGKNDG